MYLSQPSLELQSELQAAMLALSEFLQHCPHTLYDVDKKAKSILHFAIKYTKAHVLSYLTTETTEGKKIFSLKDNEGKTFIDLANELTIL